MITFAQSKHTWIILTIIGSFLIWGVVCCLALRGANAQNAQLDREIPVLRPAGLAQSNKSVAHLYFADRDYYYLMSEQRVVPHSDNSVDFARAIVEALIKGPQKSLVRTIAANTKLRAIYIAPAGVCYVDLS